MITYEVIKQRTVEILFLFLYCCLCHNCTNHHQTTKFMAGIPRFIQSLISILKRNWFAKSNLGENHLQVQFQWLITRSPLSFFNEILASFYPFFAHRQISFQCNRLFLIGISLENSMGFYKPTTKIESASESQQNMICQTRSIVIFKFGSI